MTITTRSSLRNRIDQNCRDCIYDPGARGTWRQQVTLCAVESCAFHDVRPVTAAPIPESVLDYYHIVGPERALYARSRHLEGRFSGHKEVRQYRKRTQDVIALEKGARR